MRIQPVSVQDERIHIFGAGNHPQTALRAAIAVEQLAIICAQVTFNRTVVPKQKGKNSIIGLYECGSLEKSLNWNGMVFRELNTPCVTAKVVCCQVSSRTTINASRCLMFSTACNSDCQFVIIAFCRTQLSIYFELTMVLFPRDRRMLHCISSMHTHTGHHSVQLHNATGKWKTQ